MLAQWPWLLWHCPRSGILGSSPRPPTRARQASGPENGDAAWHKCQRIDVHSCTPLAHKAKMWKLERATPDMGGRHGARGSETHCAAAREKEKGRGLPYLAKSRLATPSSTPTGYSARFARASFSLFSGTRRATCLALNWSRGLPVAMGGHLLLAYYEVASHLRKYSDLPEEEKFWMCLAKPSPFSLPYPQIRALLLFLRRPFWLLQPLPIEIVGKRHVWQLSS